MFEEFPPKEKPTAVIAYPFTESTILMFEKSIEDGTTWSGLKSAYDAQQVEQATLVTESAPTA